MWNTLLLPGRGLQWAILALLICALVATPALAGNKFEIIGGGVSGSSSVKREHLQLLLFGAGGVAVLLAVLSFVVPHKNALFLNFANWKQSAALFLVAGIAAIGGALALQ